MERWRSCQRRSGTRVNLEGLSEFIRWEQGVRPAWPVGQSWGAANSVTEVLLTCGPAAKPQHSPLNPPRPVPLPTPPPAAAIKGLVKKFGAWHGVSSLFNLGVLVTAFAHGWWLAGSLVLA